MMEADDTSRSSEKERLQQQQQSREEPPPKSKKKFCSCCCTPRSIARYCSKCYFPTCEWRGICGCPHGRCYGMMGVMSAVGGLMMNLYVLGTCSFNRIAIINPVTGEPIPGSERGYGFSARETNYGQAPDYRQCTYFPDDELDEIWDIWMSGAKIFSYLSAVLASIAFLILFTICCIAYSKSMFERWLFWGYIAAAITIAFSFLIFGSEFCQTNQCKVADGCGWAISAFFMHLMAANTVKNFPPPQPKPDKKKKGPPTIDDVYDELYYNDENDKYPPLPPDGKKRGVFVNDDGDEEFDNGDDYFDDLGNFIDPNKKDDYDRARDYDSDEDSESGSEWTYGSYSDESSEYDSDEDSEDRNARRAARDAKRAEEEEEKNRSQHPDPYAPTAANGEDDLLDSGADSQPVPPHRKPAPAPKSYGSSEREEEDPLSGIPYADTSHRYEDDPPLRPNDRVFPGDENNGNLGVGYEDLEEQPPSAAHPTTTAPTPANTAPAPPRLRRKKKKKKPKPANTIYGAPSRPSVPAPSRDDDDDGPVMA